MLGKIFPFLTWFPLVNKLSLKKDLIAGLTGAVIVLPQGIAFATIAGLPPEYGLYTAMVTPIVAALFGSSLHVVSGPTTAISIIVFSTISHYAEPGTSEFVTLALTLAFLAGIFQFIFGLVRLGTLVNFVSHTVVVGFTAGAAVLIATSQLSHVLGLVVPRGESFLDTWVYIFNNITDINTYVLTIAAITLIATIACKYLVPRFPYMLFGLAVGSIVCVLLEGALHGVKLVGEIPPHLPPLSSPDLSIATIRKLSGEAFAVALLGLIEAMSIARAIATKSHQRIDSDQEFIGQGMSNIIGSFFSCYPGSGSFTRSAVNYSAGAQTPLAAIFAAITLIFIVMLISPLTAYLPITAMSAIILIVAFNLIEFSQIKKIVRFSRTESFILIVTFLATLFLELEFAIYLGVILSLVIFLSRTSTPNIVVLAPNPNVRDRHFTNTKLETLVQCPQIKVLRIDMTIYFGSLNHIQDKFHDISDNGIQNILVVGEGINFIDLSGAEMLRSEAIRFRRKGGNLYFCELKSEVYNFLKNGGFVDTIGKNNFFSHKTDAISMITYQLNRKICADCDAQAFIECEALASDLSQDELSTVPIYHYILFKSKNT